MTKFLTFFTLLVLILAFATSSKIRNTSGKPTKSSCVAKVLRCCEVTSRNRMEWWCGSFLETKQKMWTGCNEPKQRFTDSGECKKGCTDPTRFSGYADCQSAAEKNSDRK